MRALYSCLTEQHDLVLVALAALICCLGVASGFALGDEALRSKRPRDAARWAAGGVTALASAIWATHFIAMLAFHPGLPSGFDATMTILSYVVALGWVGAGGFILLHARSRYERAIGGLVAGLAISAMHYTGMAAYRVQGHLEWDGAAVAVSVLSGAALAMLSALGANAPNPRRRFASRAAFLGAVCLDHFIAMSAISAPWARHVDRERKETYLRTRNGPSSQNSPAIVQTGRKKRARSGA